MNVGSGSESMDAKEAARALGKRGGAARAQKYTHSELSAMAKRSAAKGWRTRRKKKDEKRG
jgi:hypothetical protein